MGLLDKVNAAFSVDGVLAQNISNFSPRQAQQDMSLAVANSLLDKQTLVCEAGTGTGKTFAYLLPALLASEKVIISTATKTLQDQLFSKDLPLMRSALKQDLNIALLKGRSNYLCRYRMEMADIDQLNKRNQAWLQQIQDWSTSTQYGDISELSKIPEKAPVWTQVTSTSENCTGAECPEFESCYVFKNRKRAHNADVLVINHYVLCADMALHSTDSGELLPNTEMIIIDEAHQLPDIVSQFLGIRFSSRALHNFLHDAIAAYEEEANDTPEFPKLCQNLETATDSIVRSLKKGLSERGNYSDLQAFPRFKTALKKLDQKLEAVLFLLQNLAGRGKRLEQIAQRCAELNDNLKQIEHNQASNQVAWYQLYGRRGFSFILTPLDIQQDFQNYYQAQPRTWVFTSATLSVDQDFSHFCQQLGLLDYRSACWESPFNFKYTSLLYVPETLGQPNSPDYTDTVIDAALPVLKLSQGRAFILFTSHKALQHAAKRLKKAKLNYPLLIQGDMPRGHLLAEFRQLGNAILLGTGSFWEGVDVQGQALSCVIIDKLPFTSPLDPILAARIKYLRESGDNPFMTYQLPQAVISLKQGAGRLIRDEQDYGLLMLCDPRLIDKPYGHTFLKSLPPMSKTRYLATVQRFFNYAKKCLQKK